MLFLHPKPLSAGKSLRTRFHPLMYLGGNYHDLDGQKVIECTSGTRINPVQRSQLLLVSFLLLADKALIRQRRNQGNYL